MSSRFGMSSQAIHAAWRAHEGKSSHPGGAIAAAQLLPGPHMTSFQDILLGHMEKLLTRDGIPKSVIQNQIQSEKVISLSNWVRHALTESTTLALFGPELLNLEPNIVSALGEFDRSSWKFTYQVPGPFSKDMLSAKSLIQDALIRYFELPSRKRENASYLVSTLESEQRALKNTSKDLSASLTLLYWVANTNAWKAGFWMLTHILYSPSLKTRVLEEINPHISASVSATELQKRLEKLPLINAIYYETLRTTASSISVRDVLAPCTLSSLTLSPGSRLIIPYRQMLLDPEVFGADAESFNPDRFLKNPELARHPSFRPFGGGTTFCPGRFVAQSEAVVFVAMVLGRYDVEVVGGGYKGGPPRFEESKPCLGIMEVKGGEDVFVRIREKKGLVDSTI